MITSKSIYHSNIAVIFKEEGFIVPDNSVFSSFISGQEGVGARFLDDPILQAKILILPQLQLRIILEKKRLRVEDESQKNPQESIAPEYLIKAVSTLFPGQNIDSFGFNFDIYYRFNTFIPIKEIFSSLFISKDNIQDLLDVGLQFTFDNQKKKYKEVWFTKITSPLELATHVNRHFDVKKLPEKDELIGLFCSAYEEADGVISSLKFNV